MKPFVLFGLLLASIASQPAIADEGDDPLVGQRCQALRPLKATDKVGGVPCACESAAFVAAAAFTYAGSDTYYPKRLDALEPKIFAPIYIDSNFTLLESAKDLPREAGESFRKVETYNYYQSADKESGANRFLLARAQVLALRFSSGNTTCNVLRVEVPNIGKFVR